MSIERCDRHDRRYDTDFVESCPACVDEGADREARAAQLCAEWADDIACGGCVKNMAAMDFVEALGVDDEDIANLICDFGERNAQWRLNKRLQDKALAFFRDDPRGRQMVEDALGAEDEERARDEETERQYQARKSVA